MPDGPGDGDLGPHLQEQVEQVADLADEAREAKQEAEQARDGAVQAGAASVQAAEAVAPDDPLLDTAVRKIEAQADEDNPFGRPGQPLSRRSPFRVGFTAALGVALAYGLVNALIATRGVLILILTSAFLAIGLNPAVEALEARGLRRSHAVTIVLLVVIAFFVGFGFAIVPPIADQVSQFVDKAPDYINRLRENRQVAELDARYHFLTTASDYLKKPEKVGTAVFGGVLGAGRVVIGAFFSAFTVLILTLYLMANLPDIKATAYRLVPRSRRARVGLLSDEILSRIGGYVAGNLIISVCAGLSTFLVLLVLHVPYPVALALIVAVTDLIPAIGATLGAVIVTLVGLFVSVRTGLIVAGFYVAYQQVENYVLYPRIMKRSVDVSPVATVVAVLIGGSLLGVLGALLAIPMAAAVQLVLQEVVAPRQDEA